MQDLQIAETLTLLYPQGKTPACTVARADPAPYFKEVFKNDVYTLLKLVKRSEQEKNERKRAASRKKNEQKRKDEGKEASE